MSKLALTHALPGDDAALGYVMREHPGHLDALEDLAADLAAQSRLPVATIWKALGGFVGLAMLKSRKALDGRPRAPEDLGGLS